MKFKRKILILMIITIFALPLIGVYSKSINPNINFTEEEKQIIRDSWNKPIRVGVLPKYYPMSEQLSNGEFHGITIEFFELISKKVV